jgi:itaconyl-CoA hydratase
MSVQPGWQGRFFEDFEVGHIYRSRLGRTISEADNTQFTLLTNNSNQIHFNADYAARTEFGQLVVNSALTFSVVAGLAVIDVSENGFALGWDYVKLPNPVFVGDTIYAETEVLEKRESNSRPAQGIIKVRTLGVKQDGSVVMDFARTVMVWKHDAAPSMDLFPNRSDEGGTG